jgi:hypothetical protein
VLVAIVALARTAPRQRDTVAWLTALAAAAGALVASLGFATGNAIAGRSEWFQVACSLLLVVLATGAAFARRSVRTWTASLIGAAAVVLSLREVVVFWHGVVISSLSPSVTRLAVAVAIAAGFAAAGVSFAADDAGEPASVAADDPRRPQRAT